MQVQQKQKILQDPLMTSQKDTRLGEINKKDTKHDITKANDAESLGNVAAKKPTASRNKRDATNTKTMDTVAPGDVTTRCTKGA